MKIQVQKWGNSLALRIPKSYAVETKIENGSTVEVVVQKGALVVKPTVKDNLTLDEMLANITEENLHTEIDFGKSEGREKL
jgi:antitoxin MazE